MGSSLAQVTYTYEVSGGISAAWLAVIILFSLAYYVVTAYFLMKTADRMGVENGWFAFIPFLNLYLITMMGRKEMSWFVIMLIFSFCFGLVTMVMAILIFMDVAEMLGFERWWGILLIIPFFNIYVMYKFAFQTPR
jgi:hypothetical protein